MAFVKANDITLYYEVRGDGEWLVLIAGLGTDASIFRQCIPYLAEKYKVLVFDNRGAGQTDKPDAPYSIPMMAEDTVPLMNSLGIESAYVLGVSLGGRIAIELALAHPEKVKKLMLVSTSPSVQIKLSGMAKATKRIRSLSKNEQPYYAFLRQLRASAGYDGTARLKRINIPALIAYGKKDKRLTREQIETMRKNIMGSGLAEFPGGHIFFILHNEQFVEAILNFLSGSECGDVRK